MKKSYLLPAVIVLAISLCIVFVSDGFTYLLASVMGLAIVETIKHNRSWVLKLTRWAKAKPGKAQVIISLLQIVLMILGIISGYNFKKLEYELSDTTAFVFGAVMVACFLSIPLLPKRSTIAIPSNVHKQRLVFTGIAVSSFVMMVLFGNRLEDRFPNSILTHAVKTVDQAIFQEENDPEADQDYQSSGLVNVANSHQASADEQTAMAGFVSYSITGNETINPPGYSKEDSRARVKAEKKMARMEKKKARMMKRLENRLGLGGALTVGSVLLIILLVILTCAGVCLVIGGVAALSSEVGLGLLAIVTGGFVTWQAIKAIGKVSKRDKPEIKTQP